MSGRSVVAVFALVVAAETTGRTAVASSSADELVRQARAHEAAHEDDIALRRYTEALGEDGTNADAWLGLGALRMKVGEPAEAERVYDAALARVPQMRLALLGRARARWMLGRHPEAEDDLGNYAATESDAAAYRELAGWFGEDGRAPAQLAIWRRLLAIGRDEDDAPLEREARKMVRALVIVVGGSDPAAFPVDPDPARRALARIAARGG